MSVCVCLSVPGEAGLLGVVCDSFSWGGCEGDSWPGGGKKRTGS